MDVPYEEVMEAEIKIEDIKSKYKRQNMALKIEIRKLKKKISDSKRYSFLLLLPLLILTLPTVDPSIHF